MYEPDESLRINGQIQRGDGDDEHFGFPSTLMCVCADEEETRPCIFYDRLA
jgi:hypothetical protein